MKILGVIKVLLLVQLWLLGACASPVQRAPSLAPSLTSSFMQAPSLAKEGGEISVAPRSRLVGPSIAVPEFGAGLSNQISELEQSEEEKWDRKTSFSLGGSFTAQSTVASGQNSGGASTSTTGNLAGQVRVGRFLDPHIEASLNIAGSASSSNLSDGFSAGVLSYAIDLRYHTFPFSRIDPYVTTKVGIATTFQGTQSGTATKSSGSYGLGCGVNFNIDSDTALYLEYSWEAAPQTSYTIYNNGVFIGFTQYF